MLATVTVGFFVAVAEIVTLSPIKGSQWQTVKEVTRAKRGVAGVKAVMSALAKEPAKFSSAFGLPKFKAMKYIGKGGASSCVIYRITTEEGKDFAWKVCEHNGLGQLEKQALLELSPRKKNEMTFVPDILESLSKDTKLLVDDRMTMTLTAIKQFAADLEKDIGLLHGANWCHNDLIMRNIAINGQAGKQDQFFILDYGFVRTMDKACVYEDFLKVEQVVDKMLELYRNRLIQQDKEPPADSNVFVGFRRNMDVEKSVENFRASLRKWAGVPKTENREKLFEAWAPGPKFVAVDPFNAQS